MGKRRQPAQPPPGPPPPPRVSPPKVAAPSLLRPTLLIPLSLSIAVHGAMLVALDRFRFEPAPRLTDAPTEFESSLTLSALPSPPQEEPTPPLPPPPTPAPEPTPLPTPAPAPPPVTVTIQPPASPPADVAPVAPANTVALLPMQPEAPAPNATEHAPAAVSPTPPPLPAPEPARPATFAGVAAKRAATLVYAIDASGAMTTSLPYVKEELLRSVARLDRSQRFQVIVFRQLPGAAAASFETFSETGFAQAGSETTGKLAQWIASIQPRGRSQPLAGLRAALTLHPELVFFLTRSIRRSGTDSAWGEGTRATLDELDRLNPRQSSGDRDIVIKALQFIDPDPTGMLQEIGNTHGDGPGSYSVIRP